MPELSQTPTAKKIPTLQDSTLPDLDEFANYLRQCHYKAAADTLKIVECLRFIRFNEEFIKYAISHPNDRAVYTSSHDQSLNILRDHHGTSFHFAAYSANQAEEFWKTINNIVETIARGYRLAITQNRLENFINTFYWDADIGCLEARTRGAVAYVLQMEISPLQPIDDLLQKAYSHESIRSLRSSLKYTDEDIYRAVFAYCQAYFGKAVRVNKPGRQEDLLLTRPLLAEYLPAIHQISESNPEAIPVPSHITLHQPHALTAELALETIQSHRALIQTVYCKFKNTVSIDFNLKQLVDPAHERPLKAVTPGDDGQRFNPKTRLWEIKRNPGPRGAEKDTSYPKKYPTSLFPPEGNMDLYPLEQAVAFLYDLVYCDTREEKFIWPKNAGTIELKYARWRNAPLSIGFEALRQIQINAQEREQTILYHNECLVSPALQSLKALAAINNFYRFRILVIYAKFHILQRYGINLPLLIHSPRYPHENKKIWAYSLIQQLQDMQQLIKENKNSLKVNTVEGSLCQQFFTHYLADDTLAEPEKFSLFIHYLNWIFQLKAGMRDRLLQDVKISNFLQTYKQKRDDEGNTFFHRVCTMGCHDNVMLYLLRHCSLDVSARNNAGDIALHMACAHHHVNLAKLLINQGARLNAENNQGNTALSTLKAQSQQVEPLGLMTLNRIAMGVGILLAACLMAVPWTAAYFIRNSRAWGPPPWEVVLLHPYTLICASLVILTTFSAAYLWSEQFRNAVNHFFKNLPNKLVTAIKRLELKLYENSVRLTHSAEPQSPLAEVIVEEEEEEEPVLQRNHHHAIEKRVSKSIANEKTPLLEPQPQAESDPASGEKTSLPNSSAPGQGFWSSPVSGRAPSAGKMEIVIEENEKETEEDLTLRAPGSVF